MEKAKRVFPRNPTTGRILRRTKYRTSAWLPLGAAQDPSELLAELWNANIDAASENAKMSKMMKLSEKLMIPNSLSFSATSRLLNRSAFVVRMQVTWQLLIVENLQAAEPEQPTQDGNQKADLDAEMHIF